MSSETDKLESEAELRRARVDSTLDELRDKFSVGQVVDEVSNYMKEGQGADMARNLGRQVRDNPLALGLIGAGVAWLFAGDAARSEAQHLKSRYDDWREGDDEDYTYDPAIPRTFSSGRSMRSDATGSSATGLNRPVGTASSGRVTDYSGSGSDRTSGTARTGISGTSGADSGPGVGDKMKSAASSAASAVSGTASSAGESVSNAASSAMDTASEYGRSMSDAAWRAEEAARRQAQAAGQGVYRAGRQARRSFLNAFQEEPLIMGGVALALGAAVAAAMPSTRREDEWMGSTRDDLVDDAVSYGKDAMDKAGDIAGKAYDAASEEAERKGLKPEAGSGQTLAEKAADVAKAATDKVKTEAKKEGL